MPEFTLDLSPTRPVGPPDKPLSGLTVLLVEDSRYTSEALRLMCQRSGARLRRADCLAAAWRHLRTYRPDVLIVDLGLPDGPGTGLIAGLAQETLRPPVVLAISGDTARAPAARAAGADGFLEKPLDSLASFQAAILAHLPHKAAPPPPATEAAISPDPIALHEDLQRAARLLDAEPDPAGWHYLASFLEGVARTAHDAALGRAAAALPKQAAGGSGEAAERLAHLLRLRLRSTGKGPLALPRASPELA